MDKFSIANNILQESNVVKKNFKLSGPYWAYRFMRPFLKSYNKIWRYSKGVVPWTSPASINIFDKLLTKNMSGFEYGSGSSTEYFARLLGHLESIEHNENWYNRVKNRLTRLNNVAYHYVPPQKEATKVTYDEYADFILKFPDNTFDFILVDGRNRVSCCQNAKSKLKSGGILVLDNSERDRYKTVFNLFKDWKMLNTTTGLTDTTFWFKP